MKDQSRTANPRVYLNACIALVHSYMCLRCVCVCVCTCVGGWVGGGMSGPGSSSLTTHSSWLLHITGAGV